MDTFILWLKRIKIFILERYPLHIAITQSIIGSFILYISSCIILKRNIFPLQSTDYKALSYSCLSMLLILLVIRISDEFKDREADKILFKDRCLPAGKVQYKDIAILAWISIPLLFIIQYLGNSNLYLFISLMLFTYLFYKYFFFPEIISNNLILALITHCPITLILNSYLLTFYTPHASFEPLLPLLSVASGMWMSAVAWETVRKIRLPEDETDYVTYSKILGTRGATLLPLSVLLAQVFFFGCPLDLIFIFSLSFALLFILFLAYIISPSKKLNALLQPATEAYVALGFIIIIVKGVFFYGV